LDFGNSIQNGRPVIQVIKDQFPGTVELSIAALIFAIGIGIPLGYFAARRQGSVLDTGAVVGSLLGVTIPERPGSYRRFIQILDQRIVTEFNYRYADGPQAHVFVGMKLDDATTQKAQVIATLTDFGYEVLDISADETAKLHVRYMVGGRAPALRDEIILRCEFPERPGALMKFLDGVGAEWNITLFHYRNHGADYGRVLAGFDVPPADRARFAAAVEALGYPSWDESDNPAFRLFLEGSAAA
jgi:threonine dehydratase